MNVIEQETAASELIKLARDFEGEAFGEHSHTRWLKMRRAAAQIRFCAQLVEQGTYGYDMAEAWYRAGRLTLSKLVASRQEIEK